MVKNPNLAYNLFFFPMGLGRTNNPDKGKKKPVNASRAASAGLMCLKGLLTYAIGLSRALVAGIKLVNL